MDPTHDLEERKMKLGAFLILYLMVAAVAVVVPLQGLAQHADETTTEPSYELVLSAGKNGPLISETGPADGDYVVHTTNGNAITLSYSGAASLSDGVLSLFNSGTLGNPHQGTGDGNAISGLADLIVEFSNGPLYISYGFGQDLAVRGQVLTSGEPYDFNEGHPSYFELLSGADLGTTVDITKVTIHYSCARTTDDPNYASDCLTFEDIDDSTCQVTGYTGTSTDVVIPANHEGKRVTEIGANAFASSPSLDPTAEPPNKNIRSISIGSEVETIGDGAFTTCNALETLILPSKVNSLPLEAVSGLPRSLRVIKGNEKFPSINNCLISGDTLMLGCRNSVIPTNSGISVIGVDAFKVCKELKKKKITIPGNIEKINGGAFSGCTGITELVIPSSVIEVASTVFFKWGEEQTIQVPFAEGEKPTGWDVNWNNGCNATIVYAAA